LGLFGHLVGKVVEERAREVEVRVAQKLAAAQARYMALIRSLPEGPLREQVLVARELSSAVSGGGTRGEEAPCPVCKRKAQTAGSVDVDWNHVFEGLNRGLQTYFPEVLYCPVCGLDLETSEQLVAAGLAESWELDEWADPDGDYWDGYEPDEDDFRDR
jgi:hypothetical protein